MRDAEAGTFPGTVGAAIGLLLIVAMLTGCGDGDGPDGDASGEFYGVVTAHPLPDEPKLDQLGRGGVGTLRFNLPWGSVQRSLDAGSDWTTYDALVRAAARNGIRVFPTIYSSPVWAEPTPEHPPLGANLHRFAAFAKAAVERYGAGGSFWRENPALPNLPVTDWEVWNEPNRTEFWATGPDPQEYVALLRALSDAIKGADPSARVVLAGLFPSPQPGQGIPLEDYLPEIYRAGASGLFDALGVHPYAGTPATALDRVKETRALMDRFGDTGKPIWVTEVGWATGGVPSGVTVDLETQAEYLTEAFELLGENRGRLGIAGVIWYSLADVPGGDLWPHHCGLFTLDGSAKPSWGAFVEAAGDTT